MLFRSILSARRQALAPVTSEIERIEAPSESEVTIRLRHPSAFLHEAISDVVMESPNARLVGTGPFKVSRKPDGLIGTDTLEMTANTGYYRGAPAIDRVVLKAYPSLRTAWAEFLRHNVDMLYDVTGEGLDLLSGSTTARTISFRRPYQFQILLNTHVAALADPSVRRRLNEIGRAHV